MYRVAGYLAALEVTGLLGFVVTSRYQEATAYRFLPLLIALVVVGYVAYSKAREIPYKEIVHVSIIASTIFVLSVQLLGFTIYSGLAKDIDFLSGENVVRVGLMLLIGMVSHVLLLILMRVIRT